MKMSTVTCTRKWTGKIHVTVDDENVQQAVIVKIEETSSPSQKRDGWARQTDPIGNIGKIVRAVIPVEGLVVIGKSSREKIDFSVAIVVTDVDTHGRLLA